MCSETSSREELDWEEGAREINECEYPSAPRKTDPALLAKNDPETWGSGGG
jgi:hypothetical protein